MNGKALEFDFADFKEYQGRLSVHSGSSFEPQVQGSSPVIGS
jgi:hypothetical protein